MRLEFDPAKDLINREKHGISLAEAQRMDLVKARLQRDLRYDYGEDRVRALGWIGERLHLLVFTMRGHTVRAISLRKANRREIEEYAKATATTPGLRRQP